MKTIADTSAYQTKVPRSRRLPSRLLLFVLLGLTFACCSTIRLEDLRSEFAFVLDSASHVQVVNPYPSIIKSVRYDGDALMYSADGHGTAHWYDLRGESVMQYTGRFRKGCMDGSGQAYFDRISLSYSGQWISSFPVDDSLNDEATNDDFIAKADSNMRQDLAPGTQAPTLDKRELEQKTTLSKAAIALKMKSTCKLTFYLSPEGHRLKVRVEPLRTNPMLAMSAYETLMTLQRLKPAFLGNRPVGSWVSISFSFNR